MKYLAMLFFLSGCANSSVFNDVSLSDIFANHAQENFEKLLGSWIGASESKLVSQWSAPTGVYKMDDGSKLLIYESSSGAIASTTYLAYTNTAVTRVGSRWCKITFTLSPNNSINGWHYDGNNCY